MEILYGQVVQPVNFLDNNNINNEMMKKILSILLIIYLSSCYKNWYKPMGYVFKNMPKGGTPGFELGWTHGCQSGLGSQYAGGFFMTFYTWSRDPDITSATPDIEKIRKRYEKELKNVHWDDPNDVKKNFSDYNRIFWTGHSHCRHSALSIQQTAGANPDLPSKDPRWDPNKSGIGSVWKLDGKGDTRIGSKGLW